MNRKHSALAFAVFFTSGISFAQNPINPEGTYFANPSARQWDDGKVYVYGTRDESSEYWSSYNYDVLSSPDLSNWTVHRDVFSSRGPNDEVAGTDALLFAPDCIYWNSVYWLFFCTPDKNFAEGVATSTSPTGPFKNGQKLEHADQIDPSVFIDDDGQIYYYWGQMSLKAAKLRPDMKGLELSTLRDSIITRRDHYFHEGVQAFKRNGIYYLTYADESRDGKPSCIGYATSISPMGPFTYRGIIIDNIESGPGVWNNHGSVVPINDKWYVFYHRPTNGQRTFRKTCIEPITFDEHGLIKEVEMTSQGAGEPLSPFTDTEARLACSLGGKVNVRTFPDKQERLSNIANGDFAAWKYFNFDQRARSVALSVIPKSGGTIKIVAGNKTVVTAKIAAGDGKTMTEIKMKLSASPTLGKHALHFYFSGEDGNDLFDLESFRFE